MPSPKPVETASLTLLGGWQMVVRTQSGIEPDYEKGRALLAYLAIEDQLHSREQLSELLWPGSPAGRANLRQVLSNLRMALNDDQAAPYLLVKRDTLRLNPQGPLWLDVAAFTAEPPACSTAQTCDSTSLAHMAQMAELYRGEFMAGFSLPDCPAFEDWLQVQREALHRRALALLERLSNGHEQLGDNAKALQFALRYAELEPWDEAACRRVMRLYALNGQYSSALAQFDTCCRLLKSELGVLPSEQTQRLAERVRQGEWQQRSSKRESEPAPALAAATAQRCQVTVLYCEIILPQLDDPEEAMALLAAPQARCVAIIRQFLGHIVQSHGGGLLAYFGLLQADEDAARHAVQAALAVTRQAVPGLDIRVGVHTGLIITGGDAAMPDTLGKTSRLAIALRLGGARNEVLVSGQTRRIVGGYADCLSLGLQLLPGLTQPLEIFKVLRESGACTRLEAAAQLTPLTGRQAEIGQLMACWQRAAQGEPQRVLIQGEAGIGKSRLLQALKDRLADRPHATRELRCYPEFSQSPFHPLIVLFEHVFGFVQGDTAEQKFDKLVQYLQTHYPTAAADDIPLLVKLLALPLGPSCQMPDISPQTAKDRTNRIILDQLEALAAELPTLLIVEDLHWIDPSTLELLTLYVRGATKGAVLALFTARPEFVRPWPQALDATLSLGPLADDDVAAIVRFMAKDLAPAAVSSIVKRADGVPLFAEELASFAALNQQASIPGTLQDLLAARIDRLGDAKPIAQLAATLGREFDVKLLRQVFAGDPGLPEQGLSALLAAGLIVRCRQTSCQFKHALIQEAAYQSQSRADRLATHNRVAQVLLSDFPELVASRPELLAQHLSNGGDTAQSISYWIKAGQRAALNCANQEAIGHFKSGLQLLTALPPDQRRDRIELSLLIGLCPALYAANGYGCKEAEQASSRISALNKLVSDNPKLFQTQWALMVSTIAGSSSRGMPQAAMQLLAMAQDDPLKKMAAHSLAALASFWLGDFATARVHDEQAIALYHPDQRGLLVRQFGSDLVVNCSAYLACSLYFLGYPDQAQRACQRMLEQARALAHPHTLAQALSFAALLQRWLNQPAHALALSAEAITLSRAHQFSLWLACGEMTHGWALVLQGQQAHEGLSEIDASIAAMRLALGGISVVFLSSRIEACIHLSQHEKALELLAQAQADSEKTGDRHFSAELHRLKGLCLLALDPANAVQAEACFEQALSLSRQQQAKALALRAATSLARLWLSQGKAQDARRMLEDVCSGFTEGFAGHDFQEAAKLLQKLV